MGNSLLTVRVINHKYVVADAAKWENRGDAEASLDKNRFTIDVRFPLYWKEDGDVI